MTKKKRIILIIIMVVLAVLILGGWWYIFSYEDCMFSVQESTCNGSCDFTSVITHKYCK